MDIVEIWNSIGYFDGILFTIWLGILYYGKCWIDSRFKKNIRLCNSVGRVVDL